MHIIDRIKIQFKVYKLYVNINIMIISSDPKTLKLLVGNTLTA